MHVREGVKELVFLLNVREAPFGTRKVLRKENNEKK